MSSSSSSDMPTDTVLERVQNFLLDNKRAILIGAAAAVAVGGAAAYYASTSSERRRAGDPEKGEGKKDKKKGGKKKKSAKSSTKDSPILEDKSAKVADETDDETLTAEAILAMPEEERTRIAKSFKEKGNKAYGDRDFSVAERFYTRAIEVAPHGEPVFYSNRAACYVNLGRLEQALQDCDSALSLDRQYIKALNRRAGVAEKLQRYEQALRDFTATSILEKFSKQETVQAVERILKLYSAEKAKEILTTREPRLPSLTFISAYFAAFRPRPLPALPENPTTGDETLLLALQALQAGDYHHAMSFVNEALDQGISWDAGKAEALNLRGTFKFVMSDVDGAKADFNESIALIPSYTQSIVKLASVHMEQGNPTLAFEHFEQAIAQNPNDPDIYYHRGQVLFIMNQFQEAADDYTKSMTLDDTFVFSHIQLAVAQYKADQIGKSMATFRRTLQAFPDRSEPLNYYGELLLDQQRPQEAIEKFDEAIAVEMTKSPTNVLPLVNKGLALFQWKQDIGAAERCCREALRLDSDCDAAAGTLAQLLLQQNKIPQAIEFLDKQVELARTEPELQAALQYKYATSAQMEFAREYPEVASQLSSIAQSLM
ncbi:TOM (translocase of outer membrane) complex component [Pleurotus pulmonarius]|nr:TOM (translocase of outer membrane) complex component [Pleurotus pulmonarius]